MHRPFHSSGTIWLLIAKYANVRSQYSDVHFITYHFKYYVITSPVCLESIIAECFTLSWILCKTVKKHMELLGKSMRNVFESDENLWEIRCFMDKTLVILWEMPFWKVFLIIYLFDYLSFIEKQWEYEKCKWKIGDREKLSVFILIQSGQTSAWV